ncbi:LpqB family beta-propeller domain-containing protein [Microbacterium sp. 18062]|uniref:LpqB family beta-propeller domain-containing protein n=1 Tax=Microbacterium sp. 18062 TaxID=2681410 RepID=UPI00135B7A2A|nr:LpqB family beta-propeller domain-containing protein [Microbacterium sp. 18062]
MRRVWRLVGVLVVVVALGGCAGLPTSGPVQPGPSYSSDPESPDVIFRPNAPQPGATPEQIVDGFVTAASGPQDNWETARLYLASDYRDAWQPEAGVIVDVLADRLYAPLADGSIDLQVTPRATVDEGGSYSRSDGGVAAPLTYELAQQEDGEWRIVRAPDGIVLDEDVFRSVFRSYALMYFDPTWEFLVPDARWFPTSNAATRVADALVNGDAASWLAESVVSAFPDNVDLLPSVPTPDGVAQAQLSAEALALDQATLDRMQTQLSASLASAQVTQVQMLVDGTRLDARRLSTQDTTIDPRALVLTEEGFGYLVSGDLTPIPGLSDAIVAAEPLAVQLARDRASAAVRLADGSAALVAEDGTTTTLDDRAGLLDPTIDAFDVVWTVPAGTPGAVRATIASGEAVEITGAWTGASRIHSMQISRDGTRMAAIVSFGSRPELVVAGVIRDADGVPSALGEPITLAGLGGDGTDVGWLDNATIGALDARADASTYIEQPIGGFTSSLEAPAGAVDLAGVNNPGAVRLRSAAGELFVRRQTNWVQTGAGVEVLAVQQGGQQ